MSEEIAVAFVDEDGTRRRYRFVPRPVHDTYRRYEERRVGDTWEPVDTAVVTGVTMQVCPEPETGGPFRV